MNRLPREDERVARALDGARFPGDRRVAGLVAVAERVREVGSEHHLDVAPAFRDALRARLVAEVPELLPRPRFPVDPVPAHAAPPRQRHPRHALGSPRRRADAARPGRRTRRRVAAATVLAAVALSGTTVVASGGALPGDPLYGLKRRVQGVEVVLARGDSERGRRHLELARTRVRELGTAAAAGSSDPLVSTLDDMDRETRDGVRLLSTIAVRQTDQAPLTELSTWTAEQRGLLATATAALPGPARTRATFSLELLSTVSVRVTSLRGTLTCDCPAPLADDLGPLPCADCDAPAVGPGAPARPVTTAPTGAPPTAAPTGAPPTAALTAAPTAGPARSTAPLPAGPTDRGGARSSPAPGPPPVDPRQSGQPQPDPSREPSPQPREPVPTRPDPVPTPGPPVIPVPTAVPVPVPVPVPTGVPPVPELVVPDLVGGVLDGVGLGG